MTHNTHTDQQNLYRLLKGKPILIAPQIIILIENK